MSNEYTGPMPEANPLIDIFQKALEVIKETGYLEEGSFLGDLYKAPFLDEMKAIIGLCEIAAAKDDYEYFKGITDTVKGVVKISVKMLKKNELLDKVSILDYVAPGIDIYSGMLKYQKSLNNLLYEDEKMNQYVISGFDAASGMLNTISGISKFVLPPLSPIAKTLSASYSLAAQAFKEEHYVEGIIIATLGTITSIMMGIAMKSLITAAMKPLATTILTSLSAFSASVSAAVAPILPLIPIVLPILAWIACIIVIQLTYEPPRYAQGGFPVIGRSFIAREAGPELVGTLNGRTAVVNNDQIVQAVSRGVYGAFKSALGGDNSKVPAIARVYLDGKQIAMAGQV